MSLYPCLLPYRRVTSAVIVPAPDVPVSNEHGWRLGRILDPAAQHSDVGRQIKQNTENGPVGL